MIDLQHDLNAIEALVKQGRSQQARALVDTLLMKWMGDAHAVNPVQFRQFYLWGLLLDLDSAPPPELIARANDLLMECTYIVEIQAGPAMTALQAQIHAFLVQVYLRMRAPGLAERALTRAEANLGPRDELRQVRVELAAEVATSDELPSQRRDDVDTLCLLAEESLLEGDADQALACILEALTLDPADKSAWQALARHNRILLAYLDALAVTTDESLVAQGRPGWELSAQMIFERARVRLESALIFSRWPDLTPKHITSENIDLDDITAASIETELALDDETREKVAWRLKLTGTVLGEYGEAATDEEIRAMLAIRARDDHGARTLLEQLLASHPHHDFALCARALLAAGNQNLAEQLTYLREAIAHGAPMAWPSLRLAEALDASAQTAAAVQVLLDAIERIPMQATPLVNALFLLWRTIDPVDAANSADASDALNLVDSPGAKIRTLATRPGVDPRVARAAAIILEIHRATDDAIVVWRDLYARGVRDAEVLCRLGDLLTGTQHTFQEGVALLEGALLLAPQSAEPRIALAYALSPTAPARATALLEPLLRQNDIAACAARAYLLFSQGAADDAISLIYEVARATDANPQAALVALSHEQMLARRISWTLAIAASVRPNKLTPPDRTLLRDILAHASHPTNPAGGPT